MIGKKRGKCASKEILKPINPYFRYTPSSPSLVNVVLLLFSDSLSGSCKTNEILRSGCPPNQYTKIHIKYKRKTFP